LYRLAPAVVAAQTLSPQGHAVDDVVHQAAVQLMPVVEPSGAEASQPSSEKADPEITGLFVDLQCSHDLPRQPVRFLPRLDLAGFLVKTGQPVLGAHPDLVAVGFDGKNMVIGQSVRRRELPPFRIDIGKRESLHG